VNSKTPQLPNSQTPPISPQPSSPETPPPLSNINSPTPKLQNSQTPPEFAPIPTYSPTTPPPPAPNSMATQTPSWKTHKVHSIPIRGRRFVCIEG
jgi:hypothetical protein